VKDLKTIQRGEGVSSTSRDKWQAKIKWLQQTVCVRHLNETDADFLRSVGCRLFKVKKDLTMQQSIRLNRIYERVLIKEPFV